MNGGGRDGRNSKFKGGGPRIPSKLTRELFGSQDASNPNDTRRGGGKVSRKERRKIERNGRKQQPASGPKLKRHWPSGNASGGANRHHLDHRHHNNDSDEDYSDDDEEPDSRPAVKKRRTEELRSKPKKSSNSKFDELLKTSLHAGGAEGMEAEREYQRQLAKKLGLKNPDSTLGNDDGLDDLLDVLGVERDSDSEGEDDKAALRAFKKEKRKKAVADVKKSGKPQRRKLAAVVPSSEDDDEDDGGSDLDEFFSGGSGEEDFDSDSGDDEKELNLLQSDSEDFDMEVDDSDGGSDSEDMLDEDDDDDTSQEDGRESEEDDAVIHKPQQQQTAAATGRYIPPAARAAAAAAAAKTHSSSKYDEEAAQVQKKVRGLLNRLAEANIQGIVADLVSLYNEHGRRMLSDAVCSELVAATAEGPRASDRFAAIAAACIAGLSGCTGHSEIIGNFIARIADEMERATATSTTSAVNGTTGKTIKKKKQDGHGSEDSLTRHNLSMVVAHLFLVGALKADIVYSLLDYWKGRFQEGDVSAMATLLKTAGLKLRGADPEEMKEFVIAVHAKAAEVRAAGKLTPRAQAMLDLVVDVKNNRSRHKDTAAAAPAVSPAVAKWLKSSNVSTVSVGGISWKKVMDKDKRKGEWWMPTAADAALAIAAAQSKLGGGGSANNTKTTKFVDKSSDAAQEATLLKLASAMRMTTETKRSIFLIIMGSEDCVDACEKLLRLNLKGTLEREIVKVTVECCLHEAVFNPYYSVVLQKLCESGKSHRMTLQYCLWDYIKEVAMMDVRKAAVLAKLCGSLVASFAVPSTMIKIADFKSKTVTAKETLFWRLFFEHVFVSVKSHDDAAALFMRIVAQPQLEEFKVGLLLFLRKSVGPWLAGKEAKDVVGGEERLELLLKRCRLVEKVLTGK